MIITTHNMVYIAKMQSFKRIFSERFKIDDEEQVLPLLNEKNDDSDLKKLLDSLSDSDLLCQYLNIGIQEYQVSEEENVMYQIRKLKGAMNMSIPKGSLILFTPDEYAYDVHIDGSKDDNCDYCGGLLMGMINEKIGLLDNLCIDIHLQLYQNNGNLERRDLVASYLNCETTDEISLHKEWRFWLLTTEDQKGFYKDFSQSNVYIIFPAHHLYRKLKEHYEMPKTMTYTPLKI